MNLLNSLKTSWKPATGFVAIGLFWGTFAASVPVIKHQLGVNDLNFGLLMLANAVGLLTAMSLAPRIDRKLSSRSVQISMIVFGILIVFPAYITAPIVFVVFMACLGFGSGLVDVLINTRVAELEAETGHPLMNANHGMFSVAYALAALTTGYFRDGGLPVTWVFLMFGVFIVLSSLMIKTPVVKIESGSETEKTEMPWAGVVVCGAIVLIAFMTEATVETWSALHIERSLGGDPKEGAFGPAMLGITMAFGRFAGQSVSARFSQYTILVWATAASVTGCLLAGLAQTPLWATVGFGILGLGVSVIGPIGLGLVGQMVSARQRSEAIAKASIIGFSGFFVAPSVMGILSESFGLGTAYVIFAGVVLLLFPLIALARKRMQTSISTG